MGETRVDWRTMEAGRDLDLIVAIRLGYKMKPMARDTHDRPPRPMLVSDMLDGYALYSPDGVQISDETLPLIVYRNFTPGVETRELPAFSADANAALVLWDEDPRWAVYPVWYEDRARGKFCATFPGHADQDAGDVYADTPALAIVRAWLSWKDADHAQP